MSDCFVLFGRIRILNEKFALKSHGDIEPQKPQHNQQRMRLYVFRYRFAVIATFGVLQSQGCQMRSDNAKDCLDCVDVLLHEFDLSAQHL